jgi:hypothetical protein
MGIEATDELFIPFDVQGTKVQFSTRSPTESELQSCPHIDMTSRNPWNPDSVELSLNEIDTSRDPGEYSGYPGADELRLCHLRRSMINQVDTSDVPSKNTFVQSRHHGPITAYELAERFCIGPTAAASTLQATTNTATRSAILPLARRYQADR